MPNNLNFLSTISNIHSRYHVRVLSSAGFVSWRCLCNGGSSVPVEIQERMVRGYPLLGCVSFLLADQGVHIGSYCMFVSHLHPGEDVPEGSEESLTLACTSRQCYHIGVDPYWQAYVSEPPRRRNRRHTIVGTNESPSVDAGCVPKSRVEAGAADPRGSEGRQLNFG